ncbi:MAG TPA: alpha/beta hydrolase [Solirubrobacterales bacterium]
MEKRDVTFDSGGTTCAATLYLPDGPGPHPTVIMAGGWCYVKEIVMPHHAVKIVEKGVACLAFDYRGFGASEGSPRQHIDPWGQIEDYRNAITFAEGLAEVDADRIGVWGISYSGGHVLILGAIEPRIRCLVSNIPVVDGWENMRRVHGETKFAELRQRMLVDRRARYSDPETREMLPMSSLEPDAELSTWPFPSIHQGFAKIKADEAPLHRHDSTLESTEMLLEYTVFPYVGRILGPKAMVVVAENDDITLWDREIAAFEGIPDFDKKLVVLPDVNHMSLYSNKSHLEIAAAAGAEWIGAHLGDATRS